MGILDVQVAAPLEAIGRAAEKLRLRKPTNVGMKKFDQLAQLTMCHKFIYVACGHSTVTIEKC